MGGGHSIENFHPEAQSLVFHIDTLQNTRIRKQKRKRKKITTNLPRVSREIKRLFEKSFGTSEQCTIVFRVVRIWRNAIRVQEKKNPRERFFLSLLLNKIAFKTARSRDLTIVRYCTIIVVYWTRRR